MKILPLLVVSVFGQSYFTQVNDVCVDNQSGQPVMWYIMNSDDYEVSNSVTVDDGGSSCMLMSTSISGGAQQDMDYAVIATWLDPAFEQSVLPLPALTYGEFSGSITYTCGVEIGNTFCCCEVGNRSFGCAWEGG